VGIRVGDGADRCSSEKRNDPTGKPWALLGLDSGPAPVPTNDKNHAVAAK